MKEINAKITSARLGLEGHGILSSIVCWQSGSEGGGFGGLHLGGPCMAIWVESVLAVFGYEDWSQLDGTVMRVRCEGIGGRTLAIGHIIDDRWLEMSDVQARMEKAVGRIVEAA